MVTYFRKRLLLLLTVMVGITAFTGCDNTLDVTADWKEIPVIYGLLNPSASYNYIRINRAYLNKDGDALTYASNPDSIQFEDLTVKLIESVNGIEGNTIEFQRVNGDTVGLAKEEGVFAQSPNILYRTGYPIKGSDFSKLYNYELVVINNKSGNVYRSKANMVGETELLSPIRSGDPRLNIDDDTNRFLFIIYREAPQAKMYDCVMRFRYKEYNVNTPNDITTDSVDWRIFTNKETIRLRGYEEQQNVIKSHLFYDFLASAIEEDPDLRRIPVDMGFYLYGAGEDLYTYIQVNKPSIGIVQKKPEFTNISDGLGIFSSLHIKAFDHVIIDDPMMNKLISSSRVENINFVRP